MSQYDGLDTNQDEAEATSPRRALWIMAAAGLFLLVVVGAAMLLSSGNKKDTSKNASDGWVKENETALDWAAPPADFDAPENPFDGIYGLDGVPEGEGELSLDDLKGGENREDAKTPKTEDETTTIDLSSLSVASSVTAKNDFTAAQMESARASSASAKTEQATSAKPKSTTSSKSTSTSRSSQSSRSAGDKFWVQVGSFEDINKANVARSVLSNNGFPAEVFTYEDGGRMMYRVRVGSYATKSEAEAIRSKVSALKTSDFSQSFVVNSTAKKQ